MKRKLLKLAKVAAVCTCSVAALSLMFYEFKKNFTINVTASMPLGIYRLTEESVQVNDDVILCPPEREGRVGVERGYLLKGECPCGSAPVLKRIVAVPGDQVAINTIGIFVNGELLKNTMPLRTDSLNRRMPTQNLSKQLEANECLVVSHNDARGFDSRYFGIVGFQQLKKVKPVWIW